MIGSQIIERRREDKEQRHGMAPAIVCIGDSITYGDGLDENREEACWVYIMERLLDGHFQTLDYGINAATLVSNGDEPYYQDFWEEAKRQEPEIVILMLGTNDSKPYNWDAARFEREMDERIEDLKSISSLRDMYLMTPPWVTPVDGADAVNYDIQLDVIRDEIRPVVIAAAKKHDLKLIDLYPITENHPEYYGDGVHPNCLGHQVIADHITRIIREDFGILKK